MAPFHNEHLLTGTDPAAALRRLVSACESFALTIPPGEDRQAAALEGLIAGAGAEIRCGALRLADIPAEAGPVIRLYKASAGRGRLKLQLFPLARCDAHPPHAHYNLVSCQIALTGRARIREFSLVDRIGSALEIREEAVRILQPGDGVFTLRRRNNIHWQEGLEDGTVLLNINWQGYFDDDPGAPVHAEHGRCYLDWDRARPAGQAGRFIVPEVAGA